MIHCYFLHLFILLNRVSPKTTIVSINETNSNAHTYFTKIPVPKACIVCIELIPISSTILNPVGTIAKDVKIKYIKVSINKLAVRINKYVRLLDFISFFLLFLDL